MKQGRGEKQTGFVDPWTDIFDLFKIYYTSWAASYILSPHGETGWLAGYKDVACSLVWTKTPDATQPLSKINLFDKLFWNKSL